jgi:hypothetical protein
MKVTENQEQGAEAMRYSFKAMILAVCALLLAGIAAAGQTAPPPKSGLPVLTTSAGQSADVNTVNILMEEAGILYDYCDVPTVDLLASGVGLGGKESSASGFHVESHTDQAKFPAGTPFKTVIFAIGASMKGMGASGLTVESEEARLKKLIDFCRKNKIFIMAVHPGGTAFRGAPGSDNERMIDAVAPFADYLVVTKDSNKDGRFTQIAKAKNIPLTEIEYALGLVDIVKKVLL